mgnify:CR=1 FL=1
MQVFTALVQHLSNTEIHYLKSILKPNTKIIHISQKNHKYRIIFEVEHQKCLK